LSQFGAGIDDDIPKGTDGQAGILLNIAHSCEWLCAKSENDEAANQGGLKACRHVQRLHHRWQFLCVLQCTQYLRHLSSLQAGGFTKAVGCAVTVSVPPANMAMANSTAHRQSFI
jgi:hypothetical protein